MPIHAQTRRPVVTTGDSFWSRMALKPVVVIISLRKTSNKLMAICVGLSREKLLQKATDIRHGRVYAVAKYMKKNKWTWWWT